MRDNMGDALFVGDTVVVEVKRGCSGATNLISGVITAITPRVLFVKNTLAYSGYENKPILAFPANVVKI